MKKILIIIPIISIIICFFALFSVSFVSAEYEIEVTLPGGPTAGSEVSLKSYIQYIYIFGLSLIGIAALGVLVYGGFMYMMSDTVVSKEDAKKYIWAAITGLILGLSAYLILNTINSDLVSLTPPELNDLSESKEPVKPTDCTDDASACTRCEVCVPSGIEEGKKICSNKCIGECKICEGEGENAQCVKKEDGEKCIEYTNGTCKDGSCKSPDKDCLTKDIRCTPNGTNCCAPLECGVSGMCVKPKEPECVRESCLVGGTPCCEGFTCIKNKCEKKEPVSYSCSIYCSNPENRYEGTRNTCDDCVAAGLTACEANCNTICHQEDCVPNY